MLKLVEDYPRQPAGLDATLWLLGNAPSGRECRRAVELFTKYHVTSDKLDKVCSSLALTSSTEAADLLRAIRAANSHKAVKAKATFSLALAGPITTRWNVSAFPAVYVIDSKGVIRFRNNLPPKIMERAIHQLIKETDDAPKK